MAFGLQVFDAAGNEVLGVSDRLFRLIDTRELPQGETSSASLSGFTSAFAVTVALTDAKNPHYATISGTTVSWQPANHENETASQLLVFAYA